MAEQRALPPAGREIAQLALHEGTQLYCYVVCTDGTLWRCLDNGPWEQLPGPPAAVTQSKEQDA